MASHGFVLSPPRDPWLQAQIAREAQARSVDASRAWLFVVDRILTGLMEERDFSSLNEIVSVALERSARVTNPCLSFQELASGEDATYPVLRFLPDAIEVCDDTQRVIMTRELAQTIAQSLSVVLRNDTTQVMVT